MEIPLNQAAAARAKVGQQLGKGSLACFEKQVSEAKHDEKTASVNYDDTGPSPKQTGGIRTS